MRTNFLEVLRIRTTGEQQEWISLLDEILNDNKSEPDFNLESYSQKNFTFIQLECLENYLKDTTKKDIYSKLMELRDELITLPVVNMTIAFEPTSNFLDRIIGIIRKKVTPQAIMHLSISRQIIGGFLLDFQGRFYDASLVNMIHALTKEKNYARL